ncbi:MAG: DUF2029 domain-containing protein [Actinobacteria bacterium]|nr:DUF2029 domain-containing protein [Actinomycetota bacterium]
MGLLADTGDATPAGVAPRAVRVAYVTCLAVLVGFAGLSIAYFVAGFNTGSLGFDFRGAFLPAAHAVLGGESPYPSVEGPALASQTAYVYPPLLAYVLIPFTILPETAASVLAVLIVAALLVATLALLGVRDLRCYAATALWAPTTNVLHMASSSILLAFAAALAWKYRATVWPLAAAIGLAVATKIILWPLLVWTLATRRLRPSGLAIVIGGGITLSLWALLDFDGLERYPAMLNRLTVLEAEDSYSLVGAFAELGMGLDAARVGAFVVGVVLAVACAVVARGGDDFRAFTLALAAALAFSPIVWLHYFVLLLVPLAIARPRFSAIWLMPLLLFLAPLNGNGDSIQPLLPALVAVAIFAVALLSPERQRAEPTVTPAAARP